MARPFTGAPFLAGPSCGRSFLIKARPPESLSRTARPLGVTRHALRIPARPVRVFSTRPPVSKSVIKREICGSSEIPTRAQTSRLQGSDPSPQSSATAHSTAWRRTVRRNPSGSVKSAEPRAQPRAREPAPAAPAADAKAPARPPHAPGRAARSSPSSR